MSRRSRKYRKRFSCGHRGFGQFCHCCEAQDKLLRQATLMKQLAQQQRQTERRLWKQSFFDDPIDLTHLPKKVVLSVRAVLKQLEQGVGFWVFAGKRLKPDRTLISVPIISYYRLLGRFVDNKFTPLGVMSHESYNRVVRIGFKSS